MNPTTPNITFLEAVASGIESLLPIAPELTALFEAIDRNKDTVSFYRTIAFISAQAISNASLHGNDEYDRTLMVFATFFDRLVTAQHAETPLTPNQLLLLRPNTEVVEDLKNQVNALRVHSMQPVSSLTN